MKKVRTVRLLKELTMDDVYILANRKISQPQISRIERGIAIPSDEEKKLISMALGESIEYVFPSDEEGK